MNRILVAAAVVCFAAAAWNFVSGSTGTAIWCLVGGSCDLLIIATDSNEAKR